ncbi:unnamed protein product [Pleuronectes platessa]|uniref:Uncharacterized protein n=1 Tax=Pleuronectes platessa TaxID=8262 RepID=A0A9N7TU65_PLEPL|nr:unnamed protein product [Pleuronectes platessa]
MIDHGAASGAVQEFHSSMCSRIIANKQRGSCAHKGINLCVLLLRTEGTHAPSDRIPTGREEVSPSSDQKRLHRRGVDMCMRPTLLLRLSLGYKIHESREKGPGTRRWWRCSVKRGAEGEGCGAARAAHMALGAQSWPSMLT